MPITVKAVTQDEYAAWVKASQDAGEWVDPDPAQVALEFYSKALGRGVRKLLRVAPRPAVRARRARPGE